MKYMGIMVTSHTMKNRKRSRALNTAIIPASTNRMSIMKALSRVSMLRHALRTQKGGSSVVSNTRGKLIPSTPRAYWILNVGIHMNRSTNCMSLVPWSKRAQRTSARSNSRIVVPRAVHRTWSSLRRKAMATSPRKGTAISQVKRWSAKIDGIGPHKNSQ